MKITKTILIVGGGPAGLFAANLLLEAGLEVQLFEKMSAPGKKFLVAGHGGLNLTHSEEISEFSKKYGKHSQKFYDYLKAFDAKEFQKFASELGVETFEGSTGRIFPKKMNAAEMLLSWMKKLKENKNFSLFNNHRLIDIQKENELHFETPEGNKVVSGDAVILSLGGGSWKKTGSDGAWIELLESKGITVEPLKSMNCGFNVSWSKHFKEVIENSPLKNISLTVDDFSTRGEVMITEYGIEGVAVYSLSREIQEIFNNSDSVTLYLDLTPDLVETEVLARLNKEKGKSSLSNHLRKTLSLKGSKFVLLKELTSKEEFSNFEKLARKIKRLPIKLTSARPIDEAISTIGGVNFSELDENLMLKKIPGTFVIGEMLDWEAPTGGYLLQGCYSTANWVSKYIKESM